MIRIYYYFYLYCRLRKSSSPSRWLIGLPPTSPRLKFIHTHPGGSPGVPRRPPRYPPSPSTRSRSLELLDSDEKKSVSPVKESEAQVRPRSRSLDGLLDEDSIVSDMKTEESSKLCNESKIDSKISLEPLDKLSGIKIEDNLSQIVSQKIQNEVEGSIINLYSNEFNDQKTNESQNPIPVPRQRLKTETKSESVTVVQQEETQKSSPEENSIKEEHPLMRPSKPYRFVSIDTSSMEHEKEDSQTSSENIDPCDNAELKKRLVVTGNDKSTLLKAKSCGAGLDSDENILSNEYKSKSREEGSLLSLPTGAEPKRKKNFMDKCVNKVRSFMKK